MINPLCIHLICLCCLLLGTTFFNPLNAELNPIRHLLALVGAHHILHVSRVRVNLRLFTSRIRSEIGYTDGRFLWLSKRLPGCCLRELLSASFKFIVH